MFKKASKKQARLRMTIDGPSGSGKTFSALSIAQGLGDKIAVIDTEHGSSEKYADKFEFDVVQLDHYATSKYVSAIEAADEAGYDVLVIDSLSHAWDGEGGILEKVDQAAKKSRTGNSYTAWREGTPDHNRLIQAVLSSKCHIIATMRTKTAYELQDKGGKKVPVKIGLAPVQRQGVEYEFDVVADIDLDHEMTISKTRFSDIADKIYKKPGKKFGATLKAWLNDGEPIEDEAGGKATPQADPPASSDFETRWEDARKKVDAFKSKLPKETYESVVGPFRADAIEAGKNEGGLHHMLSASKALAEALKTYETAQEAGLVAEA